MALREVLALPEPSKRLAELLERLDQVWVTASNRTYLNKRGKPVADPDQATRLRVIEVAAELMGARVDASGTGNGRPDLSVFNGGKAPERKTA